MNVRLAPIVGLLAFCASTSYPASAAQTPPVAAPKASAPAAGAAIEAGPVSADPATTSASYGDWVLRCQRIGQGDKSQRVCEVAQTVQLKNLLSPIAEIALGHLPKEQTMHLTTVLPASVSFPSSVDFSIDGRTEPGLQLQWRRCLPGGCFAEVVPSDELVKSWRGESASGKLTFKDATGRDVSLPVSFRGLAQALDALARS